MRQILSEKMDLDQDSKTFEKAVDVLNELVNSGHIRKYAIYGSVATKLTSE